MNSSHALNILTIWGIVYLLFFYIMRSDCHMASLQAVNMWHLYLYLPLSPFLFTSLSFHASSAANPRKLAT